MRLGQVGYILGVGLYGRSSTYEIIPTDFNMNEGTSLLINVNTTGVTSGTILYWTINNITTTNADFSATSGSFTITSGTGSFSVTSIADATTEGNETFTISVRIGSTAGTIVVTSDPITIIDTSQNPTYTFTGVPANINEGSTGTFTVTTTDVPNSTTLFWTINNITSQNADFTATSGSFTITNSAGNFNVGIVADSTTEGPETFSVSIRTGSTSGPIVATSSTVTINDTSLQPVVTFTSIPASINEGSSGTFNISVTNFPSGTLYWTTLHNSTSAADFSTNSGSFTVTNSTGSFLVTALADSLTEGPETFSVQVRINSTVGTVIGTSNLVTINDTSITPVGQFMVEGVPAINANNNVTLAQFQVPDNVFSISVVCIGGGGGGANRTDTTNAGGTSGGSGGGLIYVNAYPVSPGQILNIQVARGGGNALGSLSNGGWGGNTTLLTSSNVMIIRAQGGLGGFISSTANANIAAGTPGSFEVGSGVLNTQGRSGGTGGLGHNGNGTISGSIGHGGGGSAAGYGAAGVVGGGVNLAGTAIAALAGAGGSGGSGGGRRCVGGTNSAPGPTNRPAIAGGTGPFGQGANGTAGVTNVNTTTAGNATPGGPGSNGTGFKYGAGGAFTQQGGPGVVRIIWPGNQRQFPATRTADE
jgi:hypothetical protein